MLFQNPLAERLANMPDDDARVKYLIDLVERFEESEFFDLYTWACDQFTARTVQVLQEQSGSNAANNALLATGRLQAVPLLTGLLLAHELVRDEDNTEEADDA
jgi:hypothetical protein